MDHNFIISPDGGNDEQQQSIPITNTVVVVMMMMMGWKLYHNPLYSPTPLLPHTHSYSAPFNPFHNHTPPSTIYTDMGRLWEVHQIAELKAELDLERYARIKAESLNRKLSREVAAVQVECDEVICRLNGEIEKMKKEMEDERRMLRLAEVFREERLQMKLADAHHLYHLHSFNPAHTTTSNFSNLISSQSNTSSTSTNHTTTTNKYNATPISVHRKPSPDPENPHIKRGIKGFVEFPRAYFKAVNARKHGRSEAAMSTPNNNKVESQQAQLQLLFKTKSPLRLLPPLPT